MFSRGFRRPSSLFSKDFLTRETFFRNFGENFSGGQGHRLAVGWGGGGVLLCVASLVLRPVLSDSQKRPSLSLPALVPCKRFSPINGLLYYTGRENGSTGLKWASVGLLLNRLRACPVKKGRNGEISLTCSACPVVLSLCLSLCASGDSDRDKKRAALCGSLSLVVWYFSLSIGTLQQGCPCGWLL